MLTYTLTVTYLNILSDFQIFLRNKGSSSPETAVWFWRAAGGRSAYLGGAARASDAAPRGLFAGFSPLAHLSNLKPTDPAAPRTPGLGTPARRRRCRAGGRARAQRTRPSWFCCRRPRWTWAGRGATLAASPDHGGQGRHLGEPGDLPAP